MDEMQQIVDDLFRSGLTIEQQCNVSALLTYIATHFVTREMPLTSSERVRNYRERQKVKRETLHVTKGVSSSPPSLLPPIPPNNSPPSSPSPKIYRSNEDFDAFWHSYPRKVGKGAARKAYARALLKTNAAVIASAVTRIPVDEPEFIPHPATWLNQERWLDEKPKTNGKTYLIPGNPLQFKEKETDWVPPTAEERERRLKVVAELRAATQAVSR